SAASSGTGTGTDTGGADPEEIAALQRAIQELREVSRRGDNPIEVESVGTLNDYNDELRNLWGSPDFPRLLHITGDFQVSAEGTIFNLRSGDIVLIAPRPSVPGLVDFDPNDPATVPGPHLIHRGNRSSGSTYVLPAAAPGVRGGVQAITNTILDTGTSTGIFGWAISHVRRVAVAAVRATVPAWALAADPPASSGGGNGRVLGTLDRTGMTEAQIGNALSLMFDGEQVGDLAITYNHDAAEFDVRRYRIQNAGGTPLERSERWPALFTIDAGDELPAHEQAETQGLFSRAGNLFWSIINQVPDTPGEASGIGHVLTVTGENDRDYAFRAPTAPKAVTDAIAELQSEASTLAQSIAGVETELATALDVQAVAIASAQAYQNTLNSQRGSGEALILVITAAIAGHRASSPYSWPAGQVLWYPPTSDVGEPLFIIPQTDALTALIEAVDRKAVGNFALITAHSGQLGAAASERTALGKRIDALATVADPTFSPDFWVKNGDARTVNVRLDPRAIVAGDAKVRLILHGATVGTVALQEGRHTYGFDVSAANAGTITRAAGNAGESNVPATVELLGAGDAVTRRQHGLLRVEQSAPAPAGAGSLAFTRLLDDVAGSFVTVSGAPGPNWTITDAAAVKPLRDAAIAGEPLLVSLIAESADGTQQHTWSAWWLPGGHDDSANLHFGDLGFVDGDDRLGFEVFVRSDTNIAVMRPKPFKFWTPVLTAAGQTAGRNEAKAAAHKLRISRLGIAG
ncbi:MAG: hypothetical protein OXG35_20020, partial [Acidobacteria bacterium]|nr:hypothetical protein [Acidobacteriota bacterium]